MEIKAGDNCFYIEDQVLIGKITYFEDENYHLVVDHTYVNPDYRGQNYGLILIDKMAEYAREVKKLIIPVCPYVVKMFERYDKYQDVWFKDHNYTEACKI